MSTTRRAAPGSAFNQERFASSTEIESCFNSFLVHLRCKALSDPQDIELAWFLQYLSFTPGALKKVARDILAAHPERLGTPEMHMLGFDPEGVFHPAEVQLIVHTRSVFTPDQFQEYLGPRPRPCQVRVFLDICRDCFLKMLTAKLTSFCLDPSFYPEKLNAGTVNDWTELEEDPVFRDLRCALLNYMVSWEKKRLAGVVVTSIGRKILETLDYAESQRATVLVEGEYGTGKTFITKAWCEARPGKRRYIQAPSSNDQLDFFRTIAGPLGISRGLGMKVQEMRTRINEVLQGGHLTFVLDEAHYCFPQSNVREALPIKINWIMTSLTNNDVPVALVATPQFTVAQEHVAKNTRWASGQLVGRISRYLALSETLDENDLAAIARCLLPEGDALSIRALVLYATTSMKRLRAIEHSIKAARYAARLAGRDKVTLEDVKRALVENVLPSDSAINNAMDRAAGTRARNNRPARASKIHADPVQQDVPAALAAKPSLPSEKRKEATEADFQPSHARNRASAPGSLLDGVPLAAGKGAK